MKRRDFLKSATAVAAGSALAGARGVVARQGAGAPGNPADRLRERAEQHRHPRRRHQRAGLRGVVELLRPPDQPRDEDRPNGAPYYDRDKFKMELAEDMNVGDMSATFKLQEERDLPGRHAGHRQGREVVARPRRHRRRLPDLPDGRRLARPSPSSSSWSTTTPCASTSCSKDRLTIPDLAVIVPCVINSELVKKNATEKDPWGLEYTKQNTAGSGAYKVAKLDRRHRGRLRAQRQLGGRPAAEGQAHRLAHGAVGRQPARAARARRRRHLLRSAEQGFRRAARTPASSTIVSTPFSNGIQYHRHEREEAAVRQSQGAPGGRLRDPLPEDHGRGAVRPRPSRCSARRPTQPTEVAWPQPHKYNTDIAKAKQLMAEAGYPNGFETTLSFDLGFAERQRAALRADAGEPRRRSASRPRSTRSPARTGAPS